MEKLADEALRAIAGPDMAVLRTPVTMLGRDLTHVGKFTVAAGERVPFILTYGPSHLPLPDALDAEERLGATQAFWSEWAAKGRPPARWSEALVRSGLPPTRPRLRPPRPVYPPPPPPPP